MTSSPAPAASSDRVPPSREQLIYWLHEAAEIEHHLMCCYLYAAFSLKRHDPAWTPAQQQAVASWRRQIMSVVFEEMTHLALVGNLANALGAGPHMGRPPFPVDAGPYPAGFVIRLAPFSAATIDHFRFLERPAGEALADAQDYAPMRAYQRAVPAGRLSPGPRDYATVGELYEVLAASLQACVEAQGEAAVFVGDKALQVDASLAPLPGLAPVTDLASALQAIETIVTQGDGAGGERADSHFSRFTRIGEELAAMLAADPGFEPAWPAATNPVMNPPVHSADQRVHISGPRIAQWLDIGNAMYTTSLRCLLQGFSAHERPAKVTWLSASFALMRTLVPVGEGLAARPANDGPGGPNAGLSFTPLRTLGTWPAHGAARLVAERLEQLRQRAIELPVVPVAGESPGAWAGVIDLLDEQRAALLALAGAADIAAPATAAGNVTGPSAAPTTPAPSAATGSTTAPATVPVEVVHGLALTVLFEARRCIHSRHCVLDAPSVFKANTPGAWIYPDTVSAEALVGVAHSCPSGAIRYTRHDGGAEEAAPAVNQLRLRENGPYAVHAALHLAGQPDGFMASGEPPSGAVEPLAARDGTLQVTPLRDGPLLVRGNLELCAGTGRTVARTTEARLCHCGESKNKPFCDLSHQRAGFVADGA